MRALTGKAMAVLIGVLTERTRHLMAQMEFLNATVRSALYFYTDTVLLQFGVIIVHAWANK